MTARRPTLAALAATAAPAVRAQLVARRPTGAPDAGTPRAVPQDAGAVHQRRSTPAADGVVVVEVPGLELASEANARGHTRAAKGGRTKRIRSVVARAFHGVALPPLPLRVCVTRIAPCALDSDNIHGSGAKAVRDQVADALGLRSDRDRRVEWRVAQTKGPVGVRVTLAPLPALRSTVDAGEAADVVTLRVTREALERWADATITGDRGAVALDAGGVVVRVEWKTEVGR